MELRELIETATKVAGDQKHLAKVIGIAANNLTEAKAGRRGLPISACIELAKILDVAPITVIAASELITEKNPKKRALFAPFVHELPRKAAAWVFGIASVATIAGVAPNDVYANDTIKVSSKAGNALPVLNSDAFNWHYVKSAIRWIKQTADLLRNTFRGGLPRFGFSDW